MNKTRATISFFLLLLSALTLCFVGVFNPANSSDDALSAFFKEQTDQEEKIIEELRSRDLYLKLKDIDKQNDYLLLNKTLYSGFIGDESEGKFKVNASNFLQGYQFSQDKLSTLHEQEIVDTRYYIQHANLSWNYAELLKGGYISSPNIAEGYNKIMESTVSYFQGYLLALEDIERCVNADFAKKEFEAGNAFSKRGQYKAVIKDKGNLLRNSAKSLALNLSDTTSQRKPNVYLCKENDELPETISDEEWQVKRKEVRAKFLKDFFSEN